MQNYFSAAPSEDSYSNELIDTLRIIRSANVGPRTFFRLIKTFSSVSNALEGIKELTAKGGSRAKEIKILSRSDAVKEIEQLQKYGAKLISYRSPLYPKILLQISDPPPLLTCKGNLDLFAEKIIAMVGTRNASANGCGFASKIAKELIFYNFIIASGLARGIDTSVHKVNPQKTIAFIAGGIDHIYPYENKLLYEQISKEGLIVAECPLGSNPTSKHFSQRNRLISGVSLATIVIEAGLNSWSLITANFALEQNREVFGVPGFPMDARYQGTNKLIKEGAHLLESVEDILTNISQQPAKGVDLNDISNNNHGFSSSKINFIDKITDDMRVNVQSLLSYTPTLFDHLLAATDLPLPIIYTILLELELVGVIKWCRGNKISLIIQ